MNFAFTDDQILLRNSVRAALDEQCKPAHVRGTMGDARGFGDALWGEMAKLGWLGLPFPEEYGGAGLGLVELSLILEELGRAAYPGPYFSSVVLGGLGLMLGGSAAQKEKWLPAVASGQSRLSAALVEESLDWDPGATRTAASRSGSARAGPTPSRRGAPRPRPGPWSSRWRCSGRPRRPGPWWSGRPHRGRGRKPGRWSRRRPPGRSGPRPGPPLRRGPSRRRGRPRAP